MNYKINQGEIYKENTYKNIMRLKNKENYHFFKIKNKYFFLDVEYAELFEISKISYELLLNDLDYNKLKETFPLADIQDSIHEFNDFLLNKKELATNIGKIDDSISFLWLGISHLCNLNCSYCFLKKSLNTKKSDMMSFEVAKRALDFLKENSGNAKTLKVIFFGGEPLMNMDLIQNVIAYCKELTKDTDKEFLFSITTNGTLLCRDTFNFLKENNVGIMLSLDGQKQIHDKFRRTMNAEPTWDIIMTNVKEISNFGDYIPARATITPEDGDLVGIYKSLLSCGFKYIFFAEICPNDNGIPEFTSQQLTILKNSYWELAEYLAKTCSKIEDIAVLGFLELINSLRFSHKSVYCCSTGIHGYYVTPDGDLFPCCRLIMVDKYKMGNIFNEINRDIKQLFLENHVNNRVCRECWARYICGGACHADCNDSSGDISTPNRSRCEIIKEKIYCATFLLSCLNEKSLNEESIT